jgi:hypothetical protein
MKNFNQQTSKTLLIQLLALTVAASAFGFLLGVAYMMLNK